MNLRELGHGLGELWDCLTKPFTMKDSNGLLAAVLVVGTIIGGAAWLQASLGSNFGSSDVVAVEIKLANPTEGQQALLAEVKRQLNVWLGFANYYQWVGWCGGAIAAALTVVIGLMREQTFAKMVLMALSASISFLLGTVNPAEEHDRFMQSWRMLYTTVERIHAVRQPTDEHIQRLADVLADAENSLGRRGSKPADDGGGGSAISGGGAAVKTAAK